MQSFAQTVSEWHEFYMMMGTAAATLTGLLFVGISLNIRLLQKTAFTDWSILGAQALNNFLFEVLVALCFLIPNQTSFALGTGLLAIGLLGTANGLLQLQQLRKRIGAAPHTIPVSRLRLPIITWGAHALLCLAILAGNTDVFYWLIPVEVLVLATSSRNAWDLLTNLDAGGGSPPP